MEELSKLDLINLQANTVAMKPIGELIKGKYREGIIKRVENPFSKTGGLKVLFGTLAPDGAVVKAAGVLPEMMKKTLKARVFESEEETFRKCNNTYKWSAIY